MDKSKKKTKLEELLRLKLKYGYSIARFDHKNYSLVNLINYLDYWKEADAYETEAGNIIFNPLSGDDSPWARITLVI